jgi:hypothetical protein
MWSGAGIKQSVSVSVQFFVYQVLLGFCPEMCMFILFGLIFPRYGYFKTFVRFGWIEILQYIVIELPLLCSPCIVALVGTQSFLFVSVL